MDSFFYYNKEFVYSSLRISALFMIICQIHEILTLEGTSIKYNTRNSFHLTSMNFDQRKPKVCRGGVCHVININAMLQTETIFSIYLLLSLLLGPCIRYIFLLRIYSNNWKLECYCMRLKPLYCDNIYGCFFLFHPAKRSMAFVALVLLSADNSIRFHRVCSYPFNLHSAINFGSQSGCV